MTGTLTSKQIKYLKGLGHDLSPSVWIGKNGVSQAVITELNLKLFDDELIKVKIHTEERDDFQDQVRMIELESGAKVLQTIGRMALMYREAFESKSQDPAARKRKKEKIRLP